MIPPANLEKPKPKRKSDAKYARYLTPEQGTTLVKLFYEHICVIKSVHYILHTDIY